MRYRVLATMLFGSSCLANPPSKAMIQKIATQDKTKMICKTWAPIGSLIPNYKECRTKHDWDEMRLDTSHIAQGGSCNSAEYGTCVQGKPW